ncbi:hypothetical protein CHS0354_027793, partial [Potamilus streckersoni]
SRHKHISLKRSMIDNSEDTKSYHHTATHSTLHLVKMFCSPSSNFIQQTRTSNHPTASQAVSFCRRGQEACLVAKQPAFLANLLFRPADEAQQQAELRRHYI